MNPIITAFMIMCILLVLSACNNSSDYIPLKEGESVAFSPRRDTHSCKLIKEINKGWLNACNKDDKCQWVQIKTLKYFITVKV